MTLLPFSRVRKGTRCWITCKVEDMPKLMLWATRLITLNGVTQAFWGEKLLGQLAHLDRYIIQFIQGAEAVMVTQWLRHACVSCPSGQIWDEGVTWNSKILENHSVGCQSQNWIWKWEQLRSDDHVQSQVYLHIFKCNLNTTIRPEFVHIRPFQTKYEPKSTQSATCEPPILIVGLSLYTALDSHGYNHERMESAAWRADACRPSLHILIQHHFVILNTFAWQEEVLNDEDGEAPWLAFDKVGKGKD